MRSRICFIILALISSQLFASTFHNSKTSRFNTHYKESDDSLTEFKEIKTELPAFPDVEKGHWFDLYVSNDYKNHPKILLDSVHITPDSSIHYILNIQSNQGYNNITAEGIFCSNTSFTYNDESKRSSFKIFAYGDTTNKRWITPRNNNDWKPIGAILNSADPVRGVLYRAFCIDGTPNTDEKLRNRIIERSGRYAPTMIINHK